MVGTNTLASIRYGLHRLYQIDLLVDLDWLRDLLCEMHLLILRDLDPLADFESEILRLREWLRLFEIESDNDILRDIERHRLAEADRLIDWLRLRQRLPDLEIDALSDLDLL